MKNLFLLFAALFFISCANTESKEQKAEAVVAENQMSAAEAIRAGRIDTTGVTITEDMLRQMEAMDKAIEKAGGVKKYEEGLTRSAELIVKYIKEPNQANLDAVTNHMASAKIPIVTTDGFIEDPQKGAEHLKYLFGDPEKVKQREAKVKAIKGIL